MIKRIKHTDLLIRRFFDYLGIPTLDQMDRYLTHEIKQVGGKAKRLDVKGISFIAVLGLFLLVSIISSVIALYYIQIPEIAKDGIKLNLLLSSVGLIIVMLNAGFKKIIGGR